MPITAIEVSYNSGKFLRISLSRSGNELHTVFGGTGFSAGDYFACRHCYRLAYESQQERIRMRGLLKAQKILIRLGAKPDVLDPFPEKPLRMHWRTYQRLHRAYEIAKDRSIRGVLGRHPSELP
jgi:hypothetical protein